MSIYIKLVTLILVLTLDGQVYSGHIHGGHKSVPHSRPYMALLKMHMQDGTTKYCGGFLLNEDFVMTAAHCQAKSYTVLLGVHNVHNRSDTQQLCVKKAFPHPDFNATGYRNDIMLLKLRSRAHFNKNVRPIILAMQDNCYQPESCIVCGWGKSNRNDKYISPVLMETNVTVTDQCPKENSYCTKGETGPTVGDSGGPLVCNNGEAFGVVSSGYENICSYTKIPDFKEWINSIIQTEKIM